MEEMTNEQYIEKYPYLKELSDRYIYTSAEDVNELKNGEKIIIDSEEVSVEYLKRIIQNDYYYEYALRYLNGVTSEFSVAYIIYGDLGGNISYKRSTIVKGLIELVSFGKLTLTPEENKKYENLRSSISYEKFIEKHRGNKYNIEIEGNKYSIPFEQIILLLQLSDEEFDNICNNDEIKNINGIKKEYFIYGSLQFLKENKVMDEYVFPKNITKRYKDIDSFQKIDIQATNILLKTNDTMYQKVKIDSDLEQAILSGLPEDASDLEKAIYIYIKMCKLFTYDEEYYAVNQRGEATKKHRNIDYVSSITLDNNKIVCFEFNLIYSKLLNQLGIHFCSDYKNMVGEAYGTGHANLEFRTGKFLVKADSVTGILEGDIMQAKLNQPLVGLECINLNLQTQQEFNRSLNKMYRIIAEQEKSNENNQVGHVQSLNELLEEYSRVTDNVKDISLNERFLLLINKVNSTKMVGIDAFSYILQLRRILFNNEQKENNIGVTIVRNNEPFEEGRIAMASAIFYINDRGFKEAPDQNVYYYYNPNDELVKVTKEELQSKFDSKLIEYVGKDDPRIPGIVESGVIKR